MGIDCYAGFFIHEQSCSYHLFLCLQMVLVRYVVKKGTHCYCKNMKSLSFYEPRRLVAKLEGNLQCIRQGNIVYTPILTSSLIQNKTQGYKNVPHLCYITFILLLNTKISCWWDLQDWSAPIYKYFYKYIGYLLWCDTYHKCIKGLINKNNRLKSGEVKTWFPANKLWQN